MYHKEKVAVGEGRTKSASKGRKQGVADRSRPSPEKLSGWLLGGAMTVKDIASRLGYSTAAIYAWINQYKSEGHPLFTNVCLRKKIEIDPVELASTSTSVLAKKMNVSESAISVRKSREGIVRVRFKDTFDFRTASELSSHYIEEICEMYEVNVSTIKRTYEGYGITVPRSRPAIPIKGETEVKLRILLESRSKESTILKETGLNINQLRNYKNTRNLTKKIEQKASIDLKDFETWYIIEGKSEADIAESLGLPIDLVEKFRIRNNIPKYQ